MALDDTFEFGKVPESNELPDPYNIRLTHWDGHYVGDYDWREGVLRLFHRGKYKQYPLRSVVEKIRRSGTVLGIGEGE